MIKFGSRRGSDRRSGGFLVGLPVTSCPLLGCLYAAQTGNRELATLDPEPPYFI